MLGKAIKAGHRNLRSVGGGEESYFHGRRVRVGHLTGGLVAVLTVGGIDSDGDELVDASRERVRSFQERTEDLARDLKGRVESVWRDFR